MSESKAWYLVHAKPREEEIALLNLERQQYECFLPMAQSRKRRRGVLGLVREPLFPRYLFIHLEQGVHNFSPIRSTRGVSSLVRFGGVPAKVPSELVALIREQQLDLEEKATTRLDAKPGDRVRIMEGVMAGYEGIFEAENGLERAKVLLAISDKFTRVQVDARSLDKIED